MTKKYKKLNLKDAKKSDEQLNAELQHAINIEDYERAAELRDLIAVLKDPKK